MWGGGRGVREGVGPGRQAGGRTFSSGRTQQTRVPAPCSPCEAPPCRQPPPPAGHSQPGGQLGSPASAAFPAMLCSASQAMPGTTCVGTTCSSRLSPSSCQACTCTLPPAWRPAAHSRPPASSPTPQMEEPAPKVSVPSRRGSCLRRGKRRAGRGAAWGAGPAAQRNNSAAARPRRAALAACCVRQAGGCCISHWAGRLPGRRLQDANAAHGRLHRHHGAPRQRGVGPGVHRHPLRRRVDGGEGEGGDGGQGGP